MSNQRSRSLHRPPNAVAPVCDAEPARHDQGLAVQDGSASSALFDARSYLARHPEFGADKQAVIDLAYEEYCQRMEAGQPLDPDSFCERFPGFQTSVRKVIEVQRLLEANPDLTEECEPLAWPEPGQSFLGFNVVKELGRGAFAQVFLATEPALGNRHVAIKVSLEGATEAKTLGRLSHPNIVPVHSVQKDPATGLTVVCMPYLGRATLCDVLDRAFARPGIAPERAQVIWEAVAERLPGDGPVQEGRVKDEYLSKGAYLDGILHIAAQLAEALAFTHDQGICHGDLKPSNVLMSPAGKPMLLDFNLALDGKLHAQRLGGTLPYMSPEQLLATDSVRADPTLIDARSDIFSLGVILYELLSGNHPYGPVSLKLSTSQLRSQLLERQRSGPRPLPDQVDHSLRRLVERCLAYNPNDRPTAEELAGSLRRSLSRLRRLRRWARRHTLVVLGAACVVMAISIGAAYALAARDPYSVRQFRQGVEAYQQGNCDLAVQFFSNALKAGPPDPKEVLFARARAHQQQGLLASAQAVLALANADLEKQSQLETETADQLSLAAQDYQAAARSEQDGRVWACIGYCFAHRREHPRAIFHYEKAIKSGFGTAEVWNNLGYSRLQSAKFAAQFDAAQTAFDKAIELNPNLATSFYNRGLLGLKRAGPNKDCILAGIADMQKAIELQPSVTEAYWQAAQLCMLAARTDEQGLASTCRSRALGFLEAAREHGHDLQELNTLLFESLRGNPRFQALRSRSDSPRPLPRAVHLLDPIRSETIVDTGTGLQLVRAR